jgi:hypothetical protein
MNRAHTHVGINHKICLAIFVVAAIAIPLFSAGEAAEDEMKIYVGEFKEIFHVQDPSETIPGLGYAVSSKLAKALGEEKGIQVIRDGEKEHDIIISGTVTLDTRKAPKRILITAELKDKNGKTLKTETFSHLFDEYPASLDKDSGHISRILRSLQKK